MLLLSNKQGGINPLKLLKERSKTRISFALQIESGTSQVRLLFDSNRIIADPMLDQNSVVTEELK